MGVVISIALQKGGTGKSTTAQALASTLGFKKKRVLLIDMDSQANVTNASESDYEYSITDVFANECKVSDAIDKCKYYDLLAADDYLANLERIEVESTLLKNTIQPIIKNYDFIIIDTPPALGNLLKNSLMASDYVIIPTEPRPFALQGLDALQATIEDIQVENKDLKVLGILLIKYSDRTVLNRQSKDHLTEKSAELHTTLFKTTIREGIAVAEAQTVREPLIDYAKNSKPNIDYKAFTTEILKRLERDN